MKTASWLAGLLCIVATSISGLEGITGTWKAEDVAFAPWTFVLKAEGAKLTGTLSQ